MKLPKVEPERRHLLRAFDRLRLPGWPATLDEALCHPLYSRLLRGPAVNYAREELRQAAKPPAPIRTGRPLAAAGGTPYRTPFDIHFDPKKLAANDRDD